MLFLRTPAEQSFHRLCSTRGGAAVGFLGDSRSWWSTRRVLTARTSCGEGETPRDLWFLRSSRSGNPWSSSRIRVCACEGDRPCRRDKVATGRSIAIGFPIATGGASALVTLTERVAHELDLSSVTARLRGCSCVVLSGLDTGLIIQLFVPVWWRRSFPTRALPLAVIREFVTRSQVEMCRGVGTVVIVVVACGVPEWWHSFDYGWYLYPVWVMVCRGLTVGSACGEVVANLYHQ
ncbi:hypothetical protein Taro_006479 [Colocasia esculenta]|uniref:Uncharacterized protein n=1 Tax=Colocasia esculenta TaxID=4460 RepID=A0A843TXE8_COLES|nr:hypothetical protein [Colocasia esculenta]